LRSGRRRRGWRGRRSLPVAGRRTTGLTLLQGRRAGRCGRGCLRRRGRRRVSGRGRRRCALRRRRGVRRRSRGRRRELLPGRRRRRCSRFWRRRRRRSSRPLWRRWWRWRCSRSRRRRRGGGRRRCGARRRCSGWRRWRSWPRRSGGRRRRRCGARGRRCRGRWSLRRRLLALLGFARLSLRDDDGIGLRLGWHACELERREGGRGKQHKAKVCHGDLVPRKVLCAEGFGTVDQQPAVRPDCGGKKTQEAIYFNIATT
jgi:hypothetical protein